MGLQRDLRLRGGFVGIINAGEVLQLPALHAGILPLRIPLFKLVHGHVQEYLVEGDALVLVPLPHRVAVGPVRRYQSHQRDHTRFGEQRGDLPCPPHTLGAVGLGEGQVAVYPRAKVVSVEAIDVLAVRLHEAILQRRGDGRLSRSRTSRHPKRRSLLFEGGEARRLGEVARRLGLAVLGGAALDDVGRGGVQGGGTEGAEVDGRGVDLSVAVAGAVSGGRGEGGGGGSRGSGRAVSGGRGDLNDRRHVLVAALDVGGDAATRCDDAGGMRRR
mmetsp:Transcript_35236/g.75212  ORF Transcript_35236/g.75212 Transcript_35236/m.75212 type:complete len:273 (+) Transcript_35236:348-1166(+)